MINPIALLIIVIIDTYTDKMVLNLELGTQIKGIDELLAQLKLTIDLLDAIESNSPVDMIKNWENENNNIFTFLLDSEELKVFKAS